MPPPRWALAGCLMDATAGCALRAPRGSGHGASCDGLPGGGHGESCGVQYSTLQRNTVQALLGHSQGQLVRWVACGPDTMAQVVSAGRLRAAIVRPSGKNVRSIACH